nr:hypothetical protein BaRGS_011212 [Batillaria attramentaria]
MADKQRDVMMVVSQLKFGKYLREPAYAAAAAHLPNPITCDKSKVSQVDLMFVSSYKQGEFDILMIHRHHGILVGEPNQLRRINSPSVPGRSPGTGKTVVLVLVGGRWFIAGHDVHLLASWEKAHAAVFLIKEQLKRLLRESGHVTDDSPKIHTHFFDFADPDKGMDNVRDAVETLKKAAVNGELYVIADEAGPDDSNNTAFQQFCEQLNAAVPDLHLWAAAVQHGHKPDCLQEERLTVPLRCPPAVVKEVEKAPEFKKGHVHAYSAHPVHAPTDGPDVWHLEHVQNDKGHADQLFPKDCEHCGENIAKVLKDLDVREAGYRTRVRRFERVMKFSR